MRLNADKIIWTENALQELERLFGEKPEIEIDELEDSLGGLDFPWPITIKSVTAETDAEGTVWASLVMEFDEIAGAGSYETRMSLAETASSEALPPVELRWMSNGAGDSLSPDAAPISGDVGLLFTRGDVTSVSGAWATWTEARPAPNGADDELSFWIGTGVGAGNISVSGYSGTIPRAIALCVRGWAGATILDSSVYYGTAATPFSPPEITSVPSGALAFGAVYANSETALDDSFIPASMSGATATGFTPATLIDATLAKKSSTQTGSLIDHGIAAMAGNVETPTVDVSFPMTATVPGVGSGETLLLILADSG